MRADAIFTRVSIYFPLFSGKFQNSKKMYLFPYQNVIFFGRFYSLQPLSFVSSTTNCANAFTTGGM